MRVVRTATVPDMGRIQSTMVRGSVHLAQGTTDLTSYRRRLVSSPRGVGT